MIKTILIQFEAWTYQNDALILLTLAAIALFAVGGVIRAHARVR